MRLFRQRESMWRKFFGAFAVYSALSFSPLSLKAAPPLAKSVSNYVAHVLKADSLKLPAETALTRTHWFSTYYLRSGKGHHVDPLLLASMDATETAGGIYAPSDAGATGVAAFLQKTGKSLGLRIDSIVDERLDPEKAIGAQARFSRYYFKRFKEAYLALAAYNLGETKLRKLIKKHGRNWEILADYLPKETREHVIKVLSLWSIQMHYPYFRKKYNFLVLELPNYAYLREKFAYKKRVDGKSLEEIARKYKIKKGLLEFLNPAVKNSKKRISDYELFIPKKENVKDLEAHMKSFENYNWKDAAASVSMLRRVANANKRIEKKKGDFYKVRKIKFPREIKGTFRRLPYWRP